MGRATVLLCEQCHEQRYNIATVDGTHHCCWCGHRWPQEPGECHGQGDPKLILGPRQEAANA